MSAVLTVTITELLAAGSGLQDPLLPGPVWLNNEPVHARSLVWTAIGLIGVDLDLSSPDALAVLRGYAYSHNTTIDDIAQALTTRQLPVQTLMGTAAADADTLLASRAVRPPSVPS